MSTTLNVGELLNLVGLSTGVVLYAMLLAMVVRVGRTPGLKSGFDPLLLATSVLGLVWNLCALPAYELPKMGIEGPFPYLAAIGFAALGFLPAVVVHSVLRDERHTVGGGLKRSTAIAYAVSYWPLFSTRSGFRRRARAAEMRLLTYLRRAGVPWWPSHAAGQTGGWAAALRRLPSSLHLSQRIW